MSPLSVLAAYDRSPQAQRAIAWAHRLAGAPGRVVLLDLRSARLPPRGPSGAVDLPEPTELPYRPFGGRAFGESGPLPPGNGFADRQLELQADVEILGPEAVPASMASLVARAAQRVGPDLLVMSRHAARHSDQIPFDLVAREVALRVELPVALLGDSADPPDRSPSDAAIVVALDGSVKSEAGLAAAVPLAESLHARLHLVCAVEQRAVPAGSPPDWLDRGPSARLRRAHSYLERVSAGLRAEGILSTHEVTLGAATEVLAAAACKRRTLGFVLAARRPGADAHDTTPSVARALLRDARCPVVLVPPPLASAGDYYGPRCWVA